MKRSDLQRFRQVYFASSPRWYICKLAAVEDKDCGVLLACGTQLMCSRRSHHDQMTAHPASYTFGPHREPRDLVSWLQEPHSTTSWHANDGMRYPVVAPRRTERRLGYRLGTQGTHNNSQDQRPRLWGSPKPACGLVGFSARVLIVPISAPFATGLMHNPDIQSPSSSCYGLQSTTTNRASEIVFTDRAENETKTCPDARTSSRVGNIGCSL